MNSLTNEELRKELNDMYINDNTGGYTKLATGDIEALTALFNKHIDYIIGENERLEDTKGQNNQNTFNKIRNQLRKEQRTRAGIHTKGEESK